MWDIAERRKFAPPGASALAIASALIVEVVLFLGTSPPTHVEARFHSLISVLAFIGSSSLTLVALGFRSKLARTFTVTGSFCLSLQGLVLIVLGIWQVHALGPCDRIDMMENDKCMEPEYHTNMHNRIMVVHQQFAGLLLGLATLFALRVSCLHRRGDWSCPPEAESAVDFDGLPTPDIVGKSSG
eukprot:NODE_14840_length_1082_cov_8.685864.p1 GENE.NODE_14840_length_1082_cov_8.685864~~NODE_14840_length_1082_cov_8.685864.p1  ORF type:complete len:200 (-),score=50.58 NODE_14840_length_1082_cov_8.685864:483-1037(-)